MLWVSPFIDTKLELREIEELLQGPNNPNEWENWDPHSDSLVSRPMHSSSTALGWSLESWWWKSTHFYLGIPYYMGQIWAFKYYKQLFFFNVLEQTQFLGILENSLHSKTKQSFLKWACAWHNCIKKSNIQLRTIYDPNFIHIFKTFNKYIFEKIYFQNTPYFICKFIILTLSLILWVNNLHKIQHGKKL